MSSLDGIDDINVVEIMIGCKGSGKSWHALHRAAEIAAEYDCDIVIHDVGSSAIRKKTNPYHECDWIVVTSKTVLGGHLILKAPLLHHDIYVVNTAHAEDGLKFARQIQRKGKPIVFVVDEVVASKGIKPSGIYAPWDETIATCRHTKIALIFCMQSPTMASRFMTSNATALKCFRINDASNLKALQDKGFNDDQLKEIPTLARGDYREVSQGFPTDE